MPASLHTPVGRLLLGLLSLQLGVISLLPAGSPALAQSPGITLEAKWLLLRKEDVSAAMVQLPDRTTNDSRGQLTIRRFDPDWKDRDGAPPVPTLTINKLWLATDVATAQQIYQEQANAGFAESPVAVQSVGAIGLPALGDEARGIGGCSRCDEGVVHHRIVFRYLNSVHVVYIYGSDQYAYRDVAINWAQILNERVRAVPSGPTPDSMKTVAPRTVALSIAEVGKEIDFLGDQEGSDDRAQWYQTRFQRQPEAETRHLGPLDIYVKVWTARDIDTAQAIFNEQAQPGFPEAKQKLIGNFPMENLPGIGNENFGWSACNDDCNTEFFRFLHHRYVYRAGNIVVVLYTWGGNQDNSVEAVSFFAQAMRNRMN